MKKTIFITGGCGFIGTNISLYALKKGYKVVVFDSLIRKGSENNARILDKAGVEIVRGDVRNIHDLEKIPLCDAIIHLAGNSGIPWSVKWPMYDFTSNVVGTLNVLEFSRKNGKLPVIFASTNKVYSDEINIIPVKKQKTRYAWDFSKVTKGRFRPALLAGISEKGINEQFPMDSVGAFPHNPYGTSKAAADLYCQEYFHTFSVPTIINRMACIYGLYQQGAEEQGWLDWFVRAKMENNPLHIFGDGKQVRDELFGIDLARLYIHEIENIDKLQGHVFNVGGGKENSVSLIEAINHLNIKSKPQLNLSFEDWRLADQKINITDNSRVLEVTKWKPTTNIYKGIDMMWLQYQREADDTKLFFELI